MLLTLAQLLRVPTVAEARAFVIDVIAAAGFKSAASWQEGSRSRTLGIEVPVALYTDVNANIANITRGLFNDTAERDWLTLFSKSHYDNDRKEAVRARGPAILTASNVAPPYTIAVDYLVASDALGRTFRNKTGGTLAPGGTLQLEWEAVLAGSAANGVAPNTLTRLQTTLAGVTINNPGSGGQWLTRLGADEEIDPALRARNTTKWATRALHAPEDAYRNWALEAAVEVTRAEVDSQNPEGPGSLRIYIAGAQGAVTPEIAQIVVDYINGDGPDGIVRRAVGAEVFCSSAASLVVPVTATIYQAAAYASSARGNVETNLALFEQTHPVGGRKLDPSEPGKLLRAALYGEIMRVPGVMNADIQAPSGDIVMAFDDVVVLDLTNVTYVTV